MKNDTEIINEIELEKNHDLDFDHLIKTAIEIGNSLDGQKSSPKKPNIYFAEGLGQKIISHILSVHYLYKGYQLVSNPSNLSQNWQELSGY